MRTEGITCSCNKKDSHNHVVTDGSRSKKIVTRGIKTIKMAVPAFVFIIIPKCPVCLAGYVALGTGIGLSITTAAYLRIAIIIICILSMTWFAIKYIRRLAAW